MKLDLHTVALMVHVVWNYLMEDNATVIATVWTTAFTITLTISITTAALTILVKVMCVLKPDSFNQGTSI